MHKFKSKLIPIVLLSMALVLTACGQRQEKDPIADILQDDHAKDGLAEDDSAENSDENAGHLIDAQASGGSDAASMERYENFLAGTEKMSISKINFNQDEWSDYIPELQSDKEYTIEEFLKTFFLDRLAINDNDYVVSEMEYTYVDCGHGGQRELVLRFMAQMYYDEYNNIFVIKDVNDKLELCAWVEDGYRCYNYITPDGVIARGGSGGASSWYDSYYGIDENGDSYIIYQLEQCTANSIYFDNVDYGEIASNLGVDDIQISRYSFEGYNDAEYSDETFKKFMQECYYTYGVYTEHDEIDVSDAYYEPDSDYAKFMSLITDNWHKPAEMQEILNKRLEDLGLKQEMLQERELTWTKWEGHEELFDMTKYEPPYITVENPSWTYYATNYPYEQREDFVTLDEISHEANEIIDDDVWFDEIGIYKPEQGVFNDPNGRYTFSMTSTYGQYDHQYDTLSICDTWGGRDIATLDFYHFITPDEYAVGDGSFVKESLSYAQIVDDVLYVAISHRTYAASAPHNAYVMALDMNDNFRVIWKSEPLVCNSRNFAIVDGSLICGYGFTDEPDFIYVLNRYTGEKMNTVKVKTGPDYFYAIDGKLYVRTYDTNYVFQLGWG